MRGAVLAVVLLGCGDDPVAIPPECNGAVDLCSRRYDEVVYPTTHNAMSSAQDGWEAPNQNFNLGRQLDDGVRALMLDAHEWGDDVLLCHAFCPLGSMPLVEGLATIARFVERHRGEVVTIIFESHAPATAIDAAVRASGLAAFVHAHAPGTPWPTLRELIDADERVIIFTDEDGGGAYAWYMDVWAHAYETHYQAATIADFTCEPNRGDPAHSLFIFNHFLTDTLPQPDQAPLVNANPFLLDRATTCMAATGSLPNFVTVDFYDQGDLFAAVRALNGL